MPDWTTKFKPEYDTAKSALAATQGFAADWQPLVRRLHKLTGDEGFDAAEETSLGDLRAKAVTGPSQTRHTEDKGLLQAAKAWSDADGAALSEDDRSKLAALKLLRHTYLLNKAGSRKVWVVSLPDDFKHWPSRHFKTAASTLGAAKPLLRSSSEHFSEQQKRYLGNTAFEAVAWCQKAGIVLSNAAAPAGSGPNPGRTKARNLVRTWFAETGLDEATLDGHISTLDQGFKKMLAQLGKGHLVVTDWVPFRDSTVADEIRFRNSEAFTFRNRAEGMDVVYIESSFFATGLNVLDGQKNWTRILVHELTHLVCGTIDVVNGDSRYAWYGIGPHPGYPSTDCIRNAENWAFFAADCAGVLTDGERNTALTII